MVNGVSALFASSYYAEPLLIPLSCLVLYAHEGKPVIFIYRTACSILRQVIPFKDGSVTGGHLLELFVGPTLEVFVTVEPTPLYKKLDTRYDAGVIDLTLEK